MNRPLSRILYSLRCKVDEQIDDLLAKDIIENIDNVPSHWISPLVIVFKPNGDYRICVDMHGVNQAVIQECHLIPTIEDVLKDMNGAEMFSKQFKMGIPQM